MHGRNIKLHFKNYKQHQILNTVHVLYLLCSSCLPCTYLHLQVLGRNVRDFINELDNLHEYFRFSFPKVQPPSFCVEEECETSLTLHYRSTRKGFTQFVKGKKHSRGNSGVKQFATATGHWVWSQILSVEFTSPPLCLCRCLPTTCWARLQPRKNPGYILKNGFINSLTYYRVNKQRRLV